MQTSFKFNTEVEEQLLKVNDLSKRTQSFNDIDFLFLRTDNKLNNNRSLHSLSNVCFNERDPNEIIIAEKDTNPNISSCGKSQDITTWSYKLSGNSKKFDEGNKDYISSLDCPDCKNHPNDNLSTRLDIYSNISTPSRNILQQDVCNEINDSIISPGDFINDDKMDSQNVKIESRSKSFSPPDRKNGNLLDKASIKNKSLEEHDFIRQENVCSSTNKIQFNRDFKRINVEITKPKSNPNLIIKSEQDYVQKADEKVDKPLRGKISIYIYDICF